ncbi:alpha/beta fold hydrolase [Flexivirga caeni]|uniref:Alpha/beta hydrolase n=1 Tax=Flexivirga caeni TaxID=2294115 RepID=A0A3M9MJE1_9MICO|nr:alpha/beta fold hydrolase [Flexivirga caeni]RNI25305.1 alpha/beta hydrolase [Flexivirga caeni]
MTGLHVHHVTADDGAALTAYVREPSGGTGSTLVLAHGWVLDHRCFLPVLAHLDPSLRVVLWDQRGHGRSTLASGSRRVGRQSICRLGADLRTVLDELAPGERVGLAGHSMGGMTIMAYAGLDPDHFARRVHGVALVSTAAGGLRGSGRPGERAVLTVLRRIGTPVGRCMTEARLHEAAFGRDADPADVHDATVIVRGTRISVMSGFYDALMRHDEVTSLAALQNLPCRILVGSGDRLTPPRLAQRIARAVPTAELRTLDGPGHMLIWEAPGEVAAAAEAVL